MSGQAAVGEIIEQALDGKLLGEKEIIHLLSIDQAEDLDKLFQAARTVRKKIFSGKVFLYGFIYFSTWCRNDCNFCYYRRSNHIERYRKEKGEILGVAKKLANSGVHLVDLTMGEDELYHKENFASVLEIVRQIKKIINLPVMISPGVIGDELIDQFAAAGTDWYALYQETHNRDLFNNLRVLQDYDRRMNAKLYARGKGMLIEEGILVGVGESLGDIAHSILEMGRINASQARVMTFVPQKGIPMGKAVFAHRDLELKIIAVMRLLYPHALIPASLDIEGISGLKVRMNAGANVVTSIIPPKEGLMGVAQNTKDVDDGCRNVDEVRSVLSEIGLTAASAADYMGYINKLKLRGA